jgi:threonine dehydrogenase-like Zn-dependent dehydrogenase
VLGCFCTACGECYFCRRGDFHRCVTGGTFGHGATLGNLQGSQADLVLVPYADMVLRRVPEGMSDEVAVFAGDVMGTGFHAVAHGGVSEGDTCVVLGLGPVGLCAVQAARCVGAAQVIAVDTVPERLELAARFGAETVDITHGDAKGPVRDATDGRGADVTIEAVGDARALDMAIRLTRDTGTISAIGVYAERQEVHMGLIWIKALTLMTGQANVIGLVDRIVSLLADGSLDPLPLISHRLSLDEAAEAYALADRKVAMKALLVT